MKRSAMLGAVLGVLAAGCNSQRPEERKLPPAPAPSMPSPAPTTPSPTPPAPGPATPAAKATGFAPFDDALAGARPWVAADDKAGIVELFAVDDLSDQTKGKSSVDRRCGADAVKVVEALGKRMAERAKTGHEAPACKEDGGITTCSQPGLDKGDVRLELQYARSGEAWRVIGARTYGVGVAAAKEDARYAALLQDKCK
jgi:hypothetical protein